MSLDIMMTLLPQSCLPPLRKLRGSHAGTVSRGSPRVNPRPADSPMSAHYHFGLVMKIGRAHV